MYGGGAAGALLAPFGNQSNITGSSIVPPTTQEDDPTIVKARAIMDGLKDVSTVFAVVVREINAAASIEAGKSATIVDHITAATSKLKYQSSNNVQPVVAGFSEEALAIGQSYTTQAENETVESSKLTELIDQAVALQQRMTKENNAQARAIYDVENRAQSQQIDTASKQQMDAETAQMQDLERRLDRAEARDAEALKNLRHFEASCRELESKLKKLKNAQDAAAQIKIVVAEVIKHLISAEREIVNLLNAFIVIEKRLQTLGDNAQEFKDRSESVISKAGKTSSFKESVSNDQSCRTSSFVS